MTTYEKVQTIIAEVLGISQENITLDSTLSSLKQNSPADSLDMVELVMTAEEEFDLEIKDDEVNDFLPDINTTVREIVRFIDDHR
jgi:acyl carrier protein